MNLDALIIIAILNLIQSRFRGVMPREKSTLVEYLNKHNFPIAAKCVEAIPDSTYSQVITLVKRVRTNQEQQ